MTRRIAFQSVLMALVLGAVAALLLAVLPRTPERVDVRTGDVGPLLAAGETAQLRNFFGFYAVEAEGATRFRWTTGEGSFIVRNGARLGAPLLLTLRACGCRSGAATAPRLRLRANGERLADIDATARWGDWRRYSLLLPQRSTPYSPDVLVELLSDTVPDAASGRTLGVAVDYATLAPLAEPTRAYSPAAASALGALVGCLALLARVRGRSWAGALLAGLLGLGLAAAQGALYQHQALAAQALALGLLVSALLATALGRSAGGAALLALLLSVLVLMPQALGTWMLDDAYISFRYARNALAGHGLVFNPGERVEGYTNFLWTALFVPIVGASIQPAQASQVVTLLLALVIAALTWAGARALGGFSAAAGALALLATSAPFVLYTARGSGMETALFTLLVLGGSLAYLSIADQPLRLRSGQAPAVDARPSPQVGWWQPFAAGTLLALATLTRPEGALIAGACGLHLLVSSWRAGRIAWRRLLGLAAGFLAIFGPYYLWRFSYYGYPLPNTFYAKVGGTAAQGLRGLGYAAAFAGSQAPLIALALLGGALARSTNDQRPTTNDQRLTTNDQRPTTNDRPTNRLSSILHPLSSILHPPSSILHPRRSAFLWLLGGLYTLYIIAVGGDHFPLYRFFVPILPLLALLAALGLGRLADMLPRRAALGLMLAIAAVAIGWQAPQLYASRTLNTDGRVWSENSVVEKNREIGLWLRVHTPPDTLIATGIAGALPFYADRPVLDTLGLNDLHIAHLDLPTIGQGVAGSEKTDNAYILSRRPAYIPYNATGLLQADPRFIQAYRLMLVRGPEGRGVRVYRRADLQPPDVRADTE